MTTSGESWYIPDMPGGLYVPVRQTYEGEGTVRWAVGSPDGPRSQTWVLVGRPDGSVYIGPREHMQDMKLSLHPAKWRMAFTEEAATHRLGLGPDDDRVVQRWEKPPEFQPGWRRAACIVIAMSNLGVGYPEKKPRRGTVGWFSPLPSAHSIRFDVLVAESGNAGFRIPLYSEVGGIDFPNGWRVWVIASVPDPTDDYEERIADLRRAVCHGNDYGPDNRTWIWGESAEDRTPLIFDLSNLSPGDPPRTLDVHSSEDFPGVRTITIPATGSR